MTTDNVSMDNLITTLLALVTAMKTNTLFILTIFGAVLLLNVFNWIFLRSFLNVFGIYPRRFPGLIGIFIAPFLHGHFSHFLFNAIPLFFLANFVLLQGYPLFYCVTFVIIVFSGLLIWLFGRRAIHIGASALIMGYFGYLLLYAYEQGQALLQALNTGKSFASPEIGQGMISSIAIGFICIYYFGALLFDLFPREEEVSWEGHLFGFCAGLAAAYLMRFLIVIAPQFFPSAAL